MQNITKEKIEELKKIADTKVSDIGQKLMTVNVQEKKLAEMKSQLFVEKVKTEGEVKALKNLLDLFEEPKPEQKEGL